jgi:hypothetical protein
MLKDQPHPNAINLAFVSDPVKKRGSRCRLEIDTVTSFAFYEIKSVADMLKQWESIPIGRNFSTSLRQGTASWPIRNRVASCGWRTVSLSVPLDRGPAEVAVAGLSQWTPVSHGQYLNALSLPAITDDRAEKLANEGILLSKKQNEHLTPSEIVRLKAFGLRKPKLPKAMAELAAILGEQAASRIEAIFSDAVKVFGFEPLSALQRCIHAAGCVTAATTSGSFPALRIEPVEITVMLQTATAIDCVAALYEALLES